MNGYVTKIKLLHFSLGDPIWPELSQNGSSVKHQLQVADGC